MDMNGLKNWVLAVLAAIGSLIARFLGGWDAATILMLVMMGADFVTGVLLAVIWKKSPKTETGGVSSWAALKGFLKKLAMIMIVCIARLMDQALEMDYIRTAVVIFFIGNEGLSLIENLGLMGVPLPKFLQQMLEVLREKGDDGGKKDE